MNGFLVNIGDQSGLHHVKVEVLDLNNFAGGLVPIKRGGGLQTKSLRFIGADGRIWKFRSLDKDPSKVLPEDVKESCC